MGLVLDLRDMERLETAFFDNLYRNNDEYGGIGVDCKRPFGDSDVEGDILRIISAKPEGEGGCWSEGQREYAAALYRNLVPYLKRKYGSKKGASQ